MEFELIIAWTGFLLATYSVMGNDAPAQVLGTLIASHPDKRWRLWVGASVILVAALVYSWVNYGGVAFDRLEKIPPVPMQWYYLLGPVALLVLTRLGTPVSTSFMVLAMFTLTSLEDPGVLQKIMTKSMIGYGLAAIVAFIIWIVIARFMDRIKKQGANMKLWRPLQYISTGTLWWFWLSHDMANIAIFLPRELSLLELIIICLITVSALGLIFRESGGRVHKFVFRGEVDMDIRTATLIDAVYAFLLFVFKEWNSIPMSTTWVFVGLMAGREIARAIYAKTMAESIKIVAVRLGVLTFGAIVSLLMVGLVLVMKSV